MSSSSRDSAARIRELANKTLTDRAQLNARTAKDELDKAVADLAESRRAHKQSSAEADEQLKTICVAFDTLIEFILLNHGEIPEKLVEIIAARQEQRIVASLPKADFINQGVQEDDVVTAKTTKFILAPSQLSTVARELVGQALSRPSGRLDADEIKRDLIERLAKVRDD